MVRREAKILVTPLSVEEDKVIECLYSLFEEIAEDMAEREVDYIPVTYLKFVGEIAFNSILDSTSMSKLLNSLGSFVLLERREAPDTVCFSYSEITNRFLMRGLVNQLTSGRVPGYFGRLILGMEKMEAFVELILEAEQSKVCDVFLFLINRAKNESRSARFESNCVSLLLSMISRPDVEEISEATFETLDASEIRIAAESAHSLIKGYAIYKLDAQRCDISELRFEDTSVSFMVVDDTTKFGPSLPNIDILQVERRDGRRDVWRSEEDREAWIKTHSNLDESAQSRIESELPLVKHFDRICRRFLSQVGTYPKIREAIYCMVPSGIK